MALMQIVMLPLTMQFNFGLVLSNLFTLEAYCLQHNIDKKINVPMSNFQQYNIAVFQLHYSDEKKKQTNSKMRKDRGSNKVVILVFY